MRVGHFFFSFFLVFWIFFGGNLFSLKGKVELENVTIGEAGGVDKLVRPPSEIQNKSGAREPGDKKSDKSDNNKTPGASKVLGEDVNPNLLTDFNKGEIATKMINLSPRAKRAIKETTETEISFFTSGGAVDIKSITFKRRLPPIVEREVKKAISTWLVPAGYLKYTFRYVIIRE